MEALKLRDQRGLLECVREIHAQRDIAQLPAALLDALTRIVPSTYSAYQQVDLRDASSALIFQQPELVRTDEYERFQIHIRNDHPLLGHYARFPRSGACRLSDFISRSRFHDTGLYVEFYCPLGAEYQLSIPLAVGGRYFRGVILNRDARDFNRREQRLLNLVRPHAEQALRNAEAFAGVRRRLRAADRALEASNVGLIVADREGRVRMRTEHARVLERVYFGRPRPPSRLALVLGDWMRERIAQLDGSSEVPVAWRPLVVGHGDDCLVVRLLPDPVAGEHMLLLHYHRSSPPRRALERLGLSRRETDVLQWIALGKTNAEVAAILGLSPRTVQKHLEHVFEKLGVESRTAAARRAWESAGV